MNINNSRWNKAQKFEYNEWLKTPNIVKDENIEIIEKFQKLFTQLENKLLVNSETRILDVGCAQTCISLLIKKGKHFGIDPLANKLHYSKIVEGIKISKAVGEHIPFKDNYFDIVICRNVIDHTLNPNKVISEISRVLKKDGKLFLACYVYHPFISLLKQISEKFNIFRNIGHPHVYNPDSFHKLVFGKFEIIEKYNIYTGQNSMILVKLENI